MPSTPDPNATPGTPGSSGINTICSLLGRPARRGGEAASAVPASIGLNAVTSLLPGRRRRACRTPQHRDPRAFSTSKQTRHGCAAPARPPHTRRLLCSYSGRLTPTYSPLDGRRAASRRRRGRRRSCRRGRRSCRAPQLSAYHCCCHRQGTCESRTGDANRALGVVRRADADRERATRARARRAEGTLSSGG